MNFFPSVAFRYFFIALLTITVQACTGKDNSAHNSAVKPDKQIATIVVLPVDIPHTVDNAETDNRDLSELREGADRLSSVLKSKTEDKESMLFLSPNRTESLLGNYNVTEQKMLRYLGRDTGADAVLQTHIFRYKKRMGSNYSVSQPASVNFSYRLIHTATGNILCQGQFDETQQPLFSDLFNFFKASSRGFKWITAEELIKEGVEKEFTNCIYLNNR